MSIYEFSVASEFNNLKKERIYKEISIKSTCLGRTDREKHRMTAINFFLFFILHISKDFHNISVRILASEI